MRHIESKRGLEILLDRMERKNQESREELQDFDYWKKCVEGCLVEGLAMDETDYENAPHWFRVLWIGLR